MEFAFIGAAIIVVALLVFAQLAKDNNYFEDQIRTLKAQAFDYVEMSKTAKTSKEKLAYFKRAEEIREQINIILVKNPELDKSFALDLSWAFPSEELDLSHIDNASWSDLIKHYAYDKPGPFPNPQEQKVVHVDFNKKNRS